MSRLIRFRGALATVLVVGFWFSNDGMAAEEGTVTVMSPWQGSGQVYEVAPNRRLVLAEYAGIMYIETGEGSLDTAIMLCPAVQTIDTTTKESGAHGHCVISDANKNLVYSEWTCEGAVGACEGDFKITGGTGEFEGITGGGRMLVRTALVETAIDLSSGSVVQDAAGLAVWPELNYKIP